MRGVTRESAVQLLLALDDHVSLRLEHARQDFEHVRNSQLGDNFYIRSHFTKEKKSSPLELSVSDGDIFHVTDTLFGGTVGLWQAARVYSANANKGEPPKGVIPNQSTAESIAREQRRLGETKGRGTLLRRKLESRESLPSSEKEMLVSLPLCRPVVLFGPLADVARSYLLSQFPNRFAEPSPSDYCGGGGASGGAGGGVIRLAALDSVIASGKHCVLDISLESVSWTTTVDATNEEAWFDALRDLVIHLQQRRLWMPEFPPNLPLEDVLLFPLSSKGVNYDSDMESSKGDYADYSIRRDDSISRAPNPMARSIYDWDNSQSITSSIDSPHSSELSRTAPNLGWVTLPRRGAERAVADAPAKPHRGMTNPDIRPTNSEKRGSLPLSANNGGLSAHTSSNDDQPVSPAKEPSTQMTNGHEPPNGRQPSSPGYYHVKQVPLQPPNPDMYAPREEKPQHPQISPFANHQSPADGGPNRFARGPPQPISRPSIAPKPQLFTDGVVRNRWQDSVTPEPISRNLDSPSLLSNSLSLAPPPRSQEQPRPSGSNELSNGSSSNNNGIGQTSLQERNGSRSPRKEEGATHNGQESGEVEPMIVEETNAMIGSEGGVLNCPASGVELRIPKGAIPAGEKHEIYVKASFVICLLTLLTQLIMVCSLHLSFLTLY
ncbi:unnamed protein product [Strongylus vulgaris]|uniref:ZU5 domain-containing protein n=1 Tax=Strongylus vulgaris TaxID=40348 RepID=A0A3P7L0D0_STRVU|nr:unnamed protein product [Strongylus vulgaris]